jgi:signal transduction histidine kinase
MRDTTSDSLLTPLAQEDQLSLGISLPPKPPTSAPVAEAFYDNLVLKLATLEKLQRLMRVSQNEQEILQRSLGELYRIVAYQGAGFFLVSEETGEFTLSTYAPEASVYQLQQMVKREIDAGTFAWALRQTRPIFVRDEATGMRTLMSAMSSPTRTLGMFVALVREENLRETEDIIGLIAIALLGITYTLENRLLEQEMQDYNARLRKEVEARTAELADTNRALRQEVLERQQREVELREAKLNAEDAVRAKTEFLSYICHEIRTPLTSIHGCASLLEMSVLSDDQKEVLRLLDLGGRQLQALLNDLLDLSKMEAGALELEEASVDVRGLVNDLTQLFSMQTKDKGVELTCGIAEGVPLMVVGDPTRLRQVLFNLFSNALKFTSKGEIVIEVEYVERQEPTNLPGLQWSIHDTGIGIAKDKLDKLFKPFIQAEKSTSRQFGGTGLGLAICKKICELMGGTIWVESGLGRGSIFRFTTALQPYTQSLLFTRAIPFVPTIAAGKRICLITQFRGQRRVLTRQLQRWGLEVIELSPEMLDEATLQTCHAAVLNLPLAMDEAALAHWQSLTEKYSSLKWIALYSPPYELTKLAPEGQRHRIATVSKPIRSEQLGGALSQLLPA